MAEAIDNDIVPRSYQCNSCSVLVDHSCDHSVRACGWDIGAGNGDPQMFCPACAASRLAARDQQLAEPSGLDFAIGDVVELNSGSLKMTIVAIRIGAGNGQSARCSWFGSNNVNLRGEFPLECLKAVKS